MPMYDAELGSVKAALVRQFDEIALLRKQIASMEATIDQQAEAIRVKDAALREVADLISESSGVYGLHLNGDYSPWEEIEQGGQYERLTLLADAITIQPSPDILKERDEKVAEACMNAVTFECAIQIASGEWRKYL